MLYQIVESLWIPSQTKLCTDEGYDLLGSLIACHFDLSPGNECLPSQLKKPLSPFTATVRRREVDTPLSLEILAIDYITPRSHKKARLLEIMEAHGFQVTFL